MYSASNWDKASFPFDEHIQRNANYLSDTSCSFRIQLQYCRRAVSAHVSSVYEQFLVHQ